VSENQNKWTTAFIAVCAVGVAGWIAASLAPASNQPVDSQLIDQRTKAVENIPDNIPDNSGYQITNFYTYIYSASGKKSHKVDFSTPNILQEIGDEFAVVEANQEAHLTGIKFKGRMVNLQAVDAFSVTFQIAVDGKSQTFTISRISSGDSTAFDVYVPDLEAAKARYAEILLLTLRQTGVPRITR
jgi:hypothetical protein